MTLTDISGLDAVILCGGKGSRLQSVISDRPKGLVPIGGQPFISFLLDYLKKQKIKRVVLCTGYLKEQYEEYFRTENDMEILFSEELSPLGTGGAVRNALDLIQSDPFLVLNGDSICHVDLSRFYTEYKKNKCDLSIVLSNKTKGNEYGNVVLDNNMKIIEFNEKVESLSDSYINAGVYLLSKKIVSEMSSKTPCSIEKDFFPKIVKTNNCCGYVITKDVFDIGTPERYSRLSKGINLE